MFLMNEQTVQRSGFNLHVIDVDFQPGLESSPGWAPARSHVISPSEETPLLCFNSALTVLSFFLLAAC
jgi:hypothetical protein